jgi:putative thioredoxin
MGAVPESQVTAFIDKLTACPALGGRYRGNQEAEAVLTEGDRYRGSNLCRGAGGRHQYPSSGRAGEMLHGDRRNRASQTDPGHRAGIEAWPDAAVKAVQASIDLAEQAKALGPVTELEQKVATNPLDHQARFDLATALMPTASAPKPRTSCKSSARSQVERGRRPKQLVQFFEAWGPTDQPPSRTKAAIDGSVVARIPRGSPVLRAIESTQMA